MSRRLGLRDQLLECRRRKRAALAEQQHAVTEQHQRRDRLDVGRTRELLLRLGVDLAEDDVAVRVWTPARIPARKHGRATPLGPEIEQDDAALLDRLLEVLCRDLDGCHWLEPGLQCFERQVRSVRNCRHPFGHPLVIALFFRARVRWRRGLCRPRQIRSRDGEHPAVSIVGYDAPTARSMFPTAHLPTNIANQRDFLRPELTAPLRGSPQMVRGFPR